MSSDGLAEEPGYTDICFDRILTTAEKRCQQAGFNDGDEIGVQFCRAAQEAAIEEVQLLIDNDEGLYYNYPSSPRFNEATKGGIEIGGNECERLFRSDAEEQIERLRRDQRSGDQAKEISAGLWRSYYEQFVDIPKVKRDRWANQCRRAVTGAVYRYDSCVREKFTRPE